MSFITAKNVIQAALKISKLRNVYAGFEIELLIRRKYKYILKCILY